MMVHTLERELSMAMVLGWPMPIKLASVLCLSVLLTGLGYEILVKNKVERLRQLKAEALILKRDFEAKQYVSSNLDAHRAQVGMMDKHFASIMHNFTTENEMPGILDDISKTGVASGLTVELFAPKHEMRHDFYIELPIEIKVLGQYQQLVTFLSHMAHMRRMVNSHDIIIERQTSEKQQSELPLRMQLVASIYRYQTT